MQNKLELRVLDKDLLYLTAEWLKDPELKYLTQTQDFTYQDQLTWFNKINVEEPSVFGVFYFGSPVGVVGLKNIDFEHQTAEYFGYIADKSHRGLGIGNFMLEKMISLAKEKGIVLLWLQVLKENFPAVCLYRKHKFLAKDVNDEKILMTLTLDETDEKN